MYHILQKLKEDYPAMMPPFLVKMLTDVENTFKGATSFLEFFKSHTVSFGVKFEGFQSGIVEGPDFYSKVGPNGPVVENGAKGRRIINFEIDQFKREVQSFLIRLDAHIYVLFDKLDEFVMKEDYAIQKNIIQALISCERSYQNYDQVRLKIFVRKDLFHRLDLEELGPEKVNSRKVELVWTNADIREFMARRISYYFIKVLKLNQLYFVINRQNLLVNDRSSGALDDANEKSYLYSVIGKLRRKGGKIYELLMKLKPLARFADAAK